MPKQFLNFPVEISWFFLWPTSHKLPESCYMILGQLHFTPLLMCSEALHYLLSKEGRHRKIIILKQTDLIQIELDELVILAAFIWYQQVRVSVSQGSDLWDRTRGWVSKLKRHLAFIYNKERFPPTQMLLLKTLWDYFFLVILITDIPITEGLFSLIIFNWKKVFSIYFVQFLFLWQVTAMTRDDRWLWFNFRTYNNST